MILAGVELAIPMFLEAMDTRLAQAMAAAGQRAATRIYSDEDLRTRLVSRAQSERAGALQQPIIRIRPDGLYGSTQLNLGRVRAKVQGRIAMKLVNQRLQVQLRELYLNGQSVPSELLKTIERETNQILAHREPLLDVKEFMAREGSIQISVESR